LGPHSSFLGPFDAFGLDPFGSCLGLISPSFIIEHLDLLLPFPCHPLEAAQQVFLVILVGVILGLVLPFIALELVLGEVIHPQQVVVDHSYLF